MILGLDIGSSSVKAALLNNGRVIGHIARIPYPTRFQGSCVEVKPGEILRAIHHGISQVGSRARRADCIALSVMSPAWVAMDKHGRPITPIVTHQDRRSIKEAAEIENRIGKKRHLKLTGVRPVPGGVSSTTFAWFRKHHRSLMKRADLVGHLNTFLIRTWTGNRVIDPSNASFMGVFSTMDLSGWNDELCKDISLPKRLLPEILESNQIGGHLIREAASALGLPTGMPTLVGMIDTSAAMLLTGADSGQLLNTCGSTDVLALLTNCPHPHEQLITRAFGIGRKWMSVSTIAAAGSAIMWAHDQLFSDYSWPRFKRLLGELSKSRDGASVQFTPYLAGDRMSVEQRTAAFGNLTLSTTRRDMLKAILDSLAVASAERLPLLCAGQRKIIRSVMVSGRGFDSILRRDWPGRWKCFHESEASLRGLSKMVE